MRSRSKYLSLTRVSKAIRLPKHSLSDRLHKVLAAVDTVYTAKNLKSLPVVMKKGIPGARFCIYADTGPYEIELNPDGDHLELSLLHEIGHYIEWQSIPKVPSVGPRNFGIDPLFAPWLTVIFFSPTVMHLREILVRYPEGSPEHVQIKYLLRPDELWARAYTQYIAKKADASVLFQQLAAENRSNTGTIQYQPYWKWDEFLSISKAIDAIFESLR